MIVIRAVGDVAIPPSKMDKSTRTRALGLQEQRNPLRDLNQQFFTLMAALGKVAAACCHTLSLRVARCHALRLNAAIEIVSGAWDRSVDDLKLDHLAASHSSGSQHPHRRETSPLMSGDLAQ